MIWDRDLHEWVGPDPLHDREPDDDDFYLDDETPDDRRTLIALMARRDWWRRRKPECRIYGERCDIHDSEPCP